MLPKKHRLLKRSEFKEILGRGKRYAAPSFILFVNKNDSNALRFAFSVGKKTLKLANDRNRLRRIEREAIRAHVNEIKSGHDLIFINKNKALSFGTTEKMWGEIRLLLERAGVLK